MLLAEKDATDFLRLQASLMNFLLQQRGTGNGSRQALPYDELSMEKRFELHLRLAENRTQEIENYLAINPDRLPAEDLSEIAAWKDAITENFIFFQQLPKHLVVIEDKPKPRVFLVLGLYQPLVAILDHALPTRGTSTLLPFRGHLVCDELVSNQERIVAAKRYLALNKIYQNAQNTKTLVSHLGVAPAARPSKSRGKEARGKSPAKKAPSMVRRLVANLRSRLQEFRRQRAILKQFEEEEIPAFQAWVDTRFKKECEEASRLRNEINDLREVAFRLRMTPKAGRGNHYSAAEVDDLLAEVKSAREAMSGETATGPIPLSPDDMPDELLADFLWDTCGIDPDELPPEEYEKILTEFRESFQHLADGNKPAFERSFLGLAADRSPDHVKAVNNAYRRVAKRLHPDKHSDHDEETKDLWELLRQAKEGNDLVTIERIETEWRLLRSEPFAEDDTPRLKLLQQQLREDFLDLKELREDLEGHPMWGQTSKKPTKAIEKQVRWEITEDISELLFVKGLLKTQIELLSQAPTKPRQVQKGSAKKRSAKKRSTKKHATKKSAAKKSAPEGGNDEAESEQLEFGF